MGIGSKIRLLRRERGQSIQQVADGVGVSRAHIWQLEKEISDNPSIGLVRRLADYFNVSIKYLVDEDVNAGGLDETVARICRLAQELGTHDLVLLNDMVTSMQKRNSRAFEARELA